MLLSTGVKMPEKIGFMQGRLSEIVDDKIQAFPWLEWENEFLFSPKNKFRNYGVDT